MTIMHTAEGAKHYYHDVENNFSEVFNAETGLYVRKGNAFMRSFPNLLDVGIMGHCIHGQSGLCVKAGVQCYQSGLSKQQANMSIVDYESILKQSSGKVQQIALGGRGDPNKHSDFERILQLTYNYGIVPNYTTSGLGLTQEEVALTRRYCGAVTVSWYRSQYTLDAISAFTQVGCITNVHYVLGNNSIQEAIEGLYAKNLPTGINAVIFLLHKPVGQGESSNVLKADSVILREFFEIVNNWDGPFQIGFDSCAIPSIINFTDRISLDSIDTCEGARFSAYITPDMIMTPCSFDQALEYGVSLRESTIEEVWHSETFDRFRDSLRHSCPGCAKRDSCMGGCPLKPEIVLCEEKNK